MKPLSERVQSMLRMTMTDVADAADSLEDAFRLENADTCLAPPQEVLSATQEAVLLDDCNSYLPLRGLFALRSAIANRYLVDLDLHYNPDTEVVISCGAGESLLNALLTLINPGDSVLLTDPTYSGMAQRVRLAGGKQVFCPLRRRHDRWSLDLDLLHERAKGCRVIFFASPCMPVGTVFNRQETEAIAAAAIENDAWVIFNGHADKIVFGNKQVTNPAVLPGMRERTILVGCMSKNYLMPGWRIGWATGPSNVMHRIEDVHIFNGIMPSGFCQVGAQVALSGSQEWQKKAVSAYESAQNVLLEAVSISPRLSVIPAEGGLYCLLDTRGTGLRANEFSSRLLKEERVAVTPMPGLGE